MLLSRNIISGSRSSYITMNIMASKPVHIFTRSRFTLDLDYFSFKALKFLSTTQQLNSKLSDIIKLYINTGIV